LKEPAVADPQAIDPHHPLRGTIDRLIQLGEKGDVSVAQVVAAFGDAGLVTAMMIPALLVVSPLSGIPVFSSICGLTIALIALQMLFRRNRLWLPGVLSRRRMNGRRVAKALIHMRKSADWLDGHTAPRLRYLTCPPLDMIPKIACLLAGLTMPLLEILPFSSSLLGMAVTTTAIGFMARDGLYVLVAAGFVVLAASVPITIYALSMT
jgi:hypothetical protein